MAQFTRRNFVSSVGAAVVAPAAAVGITPEGAAPTGENPATAAPDSPDVKTVYLFFNAAEARFIEAACERLIPADESGPGALGAGVPNYLDKQLGGAWGAGRAAVPQRPLAAGHPIAGLSIAVHTGGALSYGIARHQSRSGEARRSRSLIMPAEAQDAYLKSLETGAQISTVCPRRCSSTCC